MTHAAEHTQSQARINANDSRYHDVVKKRFNKRFSGAPDYICLTRSTSEVEVALDDAVQSDRRVVVTSGGHCLEGFVADPTVKVIIDVSPMKRVYHDAKMNAVAVESGATVGETFRALFESWGTVIPLGEYPQIGMGGHVAGGAFGFLCRQLGLAADYLYGVEVVTVDAGGRPQTVIATREPSDPNRELWWAHTGAGGGNFGIVTRYWFRSIDATGSDPARLLPKAPKSVTTFKAEWSWNDIDRETFARLLTNHGAWSEQHADADSPFASLWSLLEVHRKQFGKIVARGVSTAGDDAKSHFETFVGALREGVSSPRDLEDATMTWLAFALDPLPDLFAAPPGGVSVKVKDAMLTRRLTDRQIDVAYGHLTSGEDVMGGMIGFASYGGRVNTVATDATASAQRSTILDMACNTGWLDPREETKNLAWVRNFYHDLFADTGGVPIAGEAYDGAFINHPDVDLADPSFNTSAVPWSTLYYHGNYRRLQEVKARWDPKNVFHHALSIRLPGAESRSRT